MLLMRLCETRLGTKAHKTHIVLSPNKGMAWKKTLIFVNHIGGGVTL